jgi:hypothetical protein
MLPQNVEKCVMTSDSGLGENRDSLTEMGVVLDGSAKRSYKGWAIFEKERVEPPFQAAIHQY